MVTEQEDKNNKDYALGYGSGRSSNLFEEFLANNPVGPARGDDQYAKGYQQGVADKDQFGSKPAEDCGTGETDTSSDSCCYITSACLDDLGISRTSLEMKAMKTLAKEHILKSFSGKRDYVTYGKIAPGIVQAIRSQPNFMQTWKGVYENLRQVTTSVDSGNYQKGYDQYKSLVFGLEAQFVK